MKKEEKPFLKIGTVIEAATTSFGIIRSTVTNIKTETYEKDRKTQVLYEFDNTGKYIKADEITGDRLFDLKASILGKYKSRFWGAKLAELQNNAIKSCVEFDKEISNIQKVVSFTTEETEELKVLILTATQNESLDMNHVASLVYKDVMNGMSANQVLQWLRNRVKNYSPVVHADE